MHFFLRMNFVLIHTYLVRVFIHQYGKSEGRRHKTLQLHPRVALVLYALSFGLLDVVVACNGEGKPDMISFYQSKSHFSFLMCQHFHLSLAHKMCLDTLAFF